MSMIVSVFAYVFFMDAYTKLIVGTFEVMIIRHPFLSLFFGLLFAISSTIMVHISCLRIIKSWNPVYSITFISGFTIMVINASYLSKIFDIYNIYNGFSSNLFSAGIIALLLNLFLCVLWSSIITNRNKELSKEHAEVEI